MQRVIWVGLSAALVGMRLAGPADASITTTQLDAVEELVDTGSWANLRAFLVRNPDLLAGEDPLAEEFRRFMENTSSLYTALTFQDSMFPDLGDANVVAEPIRNAAPAPSPTPAAVPTRSANIY